MQPVPGMALRTSVQREKTVRWAQVVSARVWHHCAVPSFVLAQHPSASSITRSGERCCTFKALRQRDDK